MRGIQPIAKSTTLIWQDLSPYFGVIEGVKDHAKANSAEDFSERKERVLCLECSHEEACQGFERTSEMVGTQWRFPLSKNIVGMRGAVL